jgi:hypothetical protein
MPSTDVSVSTTSTDRESGVSSTTQIEASCHAELRWLQRAREFERTPESAWRTGDVCNLERPCGFSEVRYDTQSETLLCVTGQTLVTVLSAEHETFSRIEAAGTDTTRCAACGCTRDLSADMCRHCGSRDAVRSMDAVAARGEC